MRFSWGLFLVSETCFGGATLSPRVPACPPTVGAGLLLLQERQEQAIFAPPPPPGKKKGVWFASYGFCMLIKHRSYMPKSSDSDTAAPCHVQVHPEGLCPSLYLYC